MALRVLFLGRKSVAADCLTWLLGRDDVIVKGVLTDCHLDKSVTQDAAAAAGIHVYTFDEANRDLDSGELEVDLVLSMLYWRKLGGAFLTKPQFGAINFHPAPLPGYKGVGGYNLAILNSLTEWAATAHYMDEQIDTGAIISLSYFPIDLENETAVSLEKKTRPHLEKLFKEVVDMAALQKGVLPTSPNGPGLYLSRVQLEGLKKIDFEKDDIERKVRAFWFPPYDGAYMEQNGVKYTLIPPSVLSNLADPDASSLFSQPRKKSQKSTEL